MSRIFALIYGCSRLRWLSLSVPDCFLDLLPPCGPTVPIRPRQLARAIAQPPAWDTAVCAIFWCLLSLPLPWFCSLAPDCWYTASAACLLLILDLIFITC